MNDINNTTLESNTDTPGDLSRRKFLQTGVAVAGLGLIPGISLINIAQAVPKNEAATSKNRWGMLIDTNKCGDGCTACVTACNTEFNIKESVNKAQTVQFIRKVELKNKLTGRRVTLPLMCQHCENPPCVDVCPTGASMKRADGIVRVDMHRCIGCRYCVMACPFKARSFIHEEVEDQTANLPRGKGVVDSCTLCAHRIDQDRTKPRNPACVDACNTKGHKSMWFGDLNDKNSDISKQLVKVQSRELRADLGLNTAVRYSGL